MREALEGLPGVAKADVDFGSKTATCTVDPKKFDGKKASEALAEAGFEGSEVVTDEPKKEDPPAKAEESSP